jgi:methylmalonyl-CoA mutase
MSSKSLLKEFPPVSTQSWEELIQKDLKGADYAKRLLWQSDDGPIVKPYYRAADLAGLEYLDTAPGTFPYVRGTRTSGDWRIREEIGEVDPREANLAATAAWASGAEEIEFRNVRVRDASELDILLANLREVQIHFHNADESLLRLLVSAKQPYRVSMGFDPFTNLELAATVVGKAPSTLIPFTIDGGKFEESGATSAQEIGFTLAMAIDFLAEMQSRQVSVDRAATSVVFSFAIGSNYFFQMAKLRAFRLLWAGAVEAFGGTRESAKARIHARTSQWNKTVYNPHANILRATTEAMSAGLAGADSVSIAPFDACYKAPGEASRRLARNTQILLKQESQLSRVSDPGGGSYYLEVITDFIAGEAWKAMQGIEAGGGYRKALATGQIDNTLAQSLAAKEKAVSSRRRIFVGTNQYPNLAERVLEQIDPAHADSKYRTSHPRATQTFEQLRLCTEHSAARTGKTPRILLAEIGDLKMRSARSTFSSNFLGCAGFDIVAQPFDTVDAIAGTSADLIVLCSSDPEYPNLAKALLGKLKDQHRDVPVIVAGNPESADQLKAMGVADFIHVRSNPIEVLTKLQEQLGVKE